MVAGALTRADGRVLLHRRPPGKHHGGLWEFPGGKVEAAENTREALVRELAEELGITADPAALAPVGFADDEAAGEAAKIVILLYTLGAWIGEPGHEEGGLSGWFTPAEAAELPLAPLDRILLAQFAARGG